MRPIVMRSLAGSPTSARPVAERRPVQRARTLVIDQILVGGFMLLLYGIIGPEDGGAGVQLIWITTYLVTAIGLYTTRRVARQNLIRAIPIIALVVLIVCSAGWSDFAGISLKRACELVASTGSAYLIVCRLKLEEFLQSLSFAAGLAALLSLAAVVLVPSRGVMHEEYAGAWMGIFVHKNSLGQAMAMGAITAIALVFKRDLSRRMRIWLGIAAGLCCFMLLGSQSATSVVMFIIMAAALALFALRRSRLGRRIVPVAVAIALGGLTLFALNASAVITALGRDATLSGRTDIWPLVIDAIAKRPLLGYGYDTFWLPDGSGSAYLPVLLEWTPFHAHNGLLELALDVGLVGVALFLVTLALALWRTVRLAAREREVLFGWPFLAILYFILGNITEANIAKFNGMNWVIFVVAALYAAQPRPARSIPHAGASADAPAATRPSRISAYRAPGGVARVKRSPPWA